MPRIQVTYFRQYEVEADNENDAVGITDQNFTDDIRKAFIKEGTGKISYLFKFNVEKIK